MSDKIITLKQKDTGDRLLPKTVKEAVIDLTIDQVFDGTSEQPQSGIAIKNVLSDVATSGDYNDLLNKPTIPDAQIQSDWTQADSTKVDYIKNKPTIPTVPTTLSSFTDDLGSSPTHTHSQYEVINKDVNVLSTSGTITLTDNSINTITPSDAVTFTLPTVTDNTKFHQILVQVNLSTVYAIDLGLGATPNYFNKTAPDLSAVGEYNLIYEYDKANQHWVCGAIEKGASV